MHTIFKAAAAGSLASAALAAPSAQALTVEHINFAMACSIGSNTVRVDLTGFWNNGNDWTTRADADKILFRSLKKSDGRTPTSFRPDRVTIDVRDQYNKSAKWTSRGGEYGDGATVAPNTSWDPSSKFNVGRSWRAIRVTAINTGGTSCASAWRAI